MLTVRALVDRFLGYLDAAIAGGRLRPFTKAFYLYQLRHLLRGTGADGQPLAEREASSVTFLDLAALPATHHCTRSVKRLYKWAKLRDPLEGIPVPPAGQRTRVLSPEEWRRLRLAAGYEARRILWFMSQTGARPIELRQLTWGQVSEGERVIRLKDFKARDRRKDGVRVRLIAMSAAAARVLRMWRRARHPRADDLVFRNDRGLPWKSEALRLAMKRAARRAGIDRDGDEAVVAYTLRHTFATLAVENGVQETLLADMLGHTTLSTTRRYLHRRPAELVRGLDVAMGKGKVG